MKKFTIPALCLVFASCTQTDRFTGVWNKERDTVCDGTAFPLWASKGKNTTDTTIMSSPMLLRINKEKGYYMLRCYLYDGAQARVVDEQSIFDYIMFTKADEHTLLSDNKASNIPSERQIILRVGDNGELTMQYPTEGTKVPTEKRTKALFQTIFSSGFHKLLDIRRRNKDASLIDAKLREEHILRN